ncbi:hypothetical protein SKAU_G00383580 [Synaphobranchus kaupii]|uniref:Uncharacterized protein n=1 Tax=Synaphobranchus kaupii TaxID=118154 RepID=A0A9Q1ICW1_SYNKA|nr:hypothetical protein SKAU_G00383580 [Synaphobranchus kaupii]
MRHCRPSCTMLSSRNVKETFAVAESSDGLVLQAGGLPTMTDWECSPFILHKPM